MADKQTNPSRNRAQKLKQRYGMTEEQYNTMLAAQSGKCGICARFRKLSVDHSHKSGKVRGLLCSHCNSALGLFEESVQAMQRGIAYLKKHNGGP